MNNSVKIIMNLFKEASLGNFQKVKNIFDKNKFNKLVNYTSSFNKNYPLENNCIKINYNFKNNIIYTAVLDSELTNFGRNFCLIDNEIGDFDGIKCTEIKLSVWDKILIFFKNIIN